MSSPATYSKILNNRYLNETKVIKANTSWELEAKEQQVLEIWQKKEASLRERNRIGDLKLKSEMMDKEAAKLITDCKSILTYTLSVDDKLNWEKQLQKEPFKQFIFTKQIPILTFYYMDLKVPKKSFLESIFKSLKVKRETMEKQALAKYNWEQALYEGEKNKEIQIYEIAKSKYIKEQNEYNQSIYDWKKKFEDGDSDSIEKYIRVVFENSRYPSFINKEYELQYDSNSKSVIISYFMPNTESIPNIVGYKYVATSKTIKEVEMKKKESEQLYEDIIQQIVLRSIHEIFESVYTKHVEMVVFNAWVNGVDRSTGKDFTSCILTLQVLRDEFMQIDLSRVNPKECIRKFKGLAAGPLHLLAPVKPFMNINREDRRFVESKDVLAEINSLDNLAVMPWEDFEHLVRELFAKIFSKDGSEVRVTQASRDGGVDAIAFDPDPIRGGKFIIQAKRYNIVVPVSAVRDLYGTMMNEGASKGILVTTSYYGNDSREFAKDKPITLIDGNNLIHLLNEHGHNVRIELQKKTYN